MPDEPEDAAGNAGWSESSDEGASPLPTPIVGGQPMGADEPMGSTPPPREHVVQDAPPMQAPMPPQPPPGYGQPAPYAPPPAYGAKTLTACR